MSNTLFCSHGNHYEFSPGQWECHDCGEVIDQPPADAGTTTDDAPSHRARGVTP